MHLIVSELFTPVLLLWSYKSVTLPLHDVAMLYLVGDSFMTDYFPNLEIPRQRLDEVSAEYHKQLTVEAAGWLRSQLLKAAKEVCACVIVKP